MARGRVKFSIKDKIDDSGSNSKLKEHEFRLDNTSGVLLHGKNENKLSLHGSFIKLSSFELVTDKPNSSIRLTSLDNGEVYLKFLNEEDYKMWVNAIKPFVKIPVDDVIVKPLKVAGDIPKPQVNKMAAKLGIVDFESQISPKQNVEQVRTFYAVQLEVSESRNLKKSDKLTISNAYYVLVACENFVMKTRTLAQTDPLWAENFQFICNDPQFPLMVSVWESPSQKVIGYLSQDVDHLVENSVADGDWFHLNQIKTEQLVCGDLQIRIEHVPNGLNITVIQARCLAPRSGVSSYNCKVSYGKSEKTTKKKGRSLNNVTWNETLNFDEAPFNSAISINVFGYSKMSKNTFLGHAELVSHKYFQGYLVLKPKDVNKYKPVDQSVGDLRLAITVKKHSIHPIETYSEFLEYLLENPMNLVRIFDRTTKKTGREQIASSLVKVFDSKNRAPEILMSLVSREAAAATGIETLFRANTLGSKAIDLYMKIVCYQYMFDIVHPTVQRIYKDKSSFNIDSGGEDSKKNYKALVDTLNELLDRIFVSAESLPSQLRVVFAHLATEGEKRFPEEKNVRFIAISGFLFLRLIGAAILGPKLFNVVEDHPSVKVSQNLTVVAKTLVKIASMVPSGSTAHLSQYQLELEELVQSKMEPMKKFMEDICIPVDSLGFNPTSVNLGKELSTILAHIEDHLEGEILDLYLNEEEDFIEELVGILDIVAERTKQRKPMLPVFKKKNTDNLRRSDGDLPNYPSSKKSRRNSTLRNRRGSRSDGSEPLEKSKGGKRKKSGNKQSLVGVLKHNRISSSSPHYRRPRSKTTHMHDGEAIERKIRPRSGSLQNESAVVVSPPVTPNRSSSVAKSSDTSK